MGNTPLPSCELILKLARRRIFIIEKMKRSTSKKANWSFNTNQRAKMLVWYMPAGIEKFFAEVGIPVDNPDAPSQHCKFKGSKS
jgi:hypothetical protein